MRDGRRGAALLLVLWTVVLASALAFGASHVVQHSTAAARHRIALLEASWILDGCIAQVAALSATWGKDSEPSTPDAVQQRWRDFDGYVLATTADCASTVTVTPSGSVRNVNTLDAEGFRRLLRGAGANAADAARLTDAMLDWRDADRDSRVDGAERDWYLARRRLPPRDAALASAAEIRSVRGYAHGEWPLRDVGPLDLLGTEPTAISLPHTAAAVLATVPGISTALAHRIVQAQARRDGPETLDQLVAWTVGADRDSLLRHYAHARALVVDAPAAWRVVFREPPAEIELTAVRSGRRVAIRRVRERP